MRPTTRCIIAILLWTGLAVPALAGCGDGEPELRSTEAPGSSPAAVPDTAVPAPGGSPLARRDPPPVGVEAQIGDFAELWTKEECSTEALPASPTVWAAGDKGTDVFVVATEGNGICLAGFAAYGGVEVTVTAPDGQSTTHTVQTDVSGSGRLDWTSLPGDAAGDYAITAAQGDVTAGGRFSVADPTEPQIVVVPPEGPPGTLFDAAVAGLPPYAPATLHVYRRDPPVDPSIDSSMTAGEPFDWLYAATLTAVTDARGGAVVPISSGATDAANWYLALPDGMAPESKRGVFFITR